MPKANDMCRKDTKYVDDYFSVCSDEKKDAMTLKEMNRLKSNGSVQEAVYMWPEHHSTHA